MKIPWNQKDRWSPSRLAGASEAQADQQALDEAKVFRQKLLDEGKILAG